MGLTNILFLNLGLADDQRSIVCFFKSLEYIKYDSDNMSTVELFLSESDHNHLRIKISAETKKEILNYFNQNIFSFKSIVKILER